MTYLVKDFHIDAIHTHENKYTIGEFEMSGVGMVLVLVFDTEPNHMSPHFHIFKYYSVKIGGMNYRAIDMNFHTMICIKKPEYFYQTGYPTMILNSVQRDEFVKFIRSTSYFGDDFKNLNMTSWDLATAMLDIDRKRRMKGKLLMPRYDKLPISFK